MNYEDMSISELKDYAKSIGIVVGNCGKEKLIEKIRNKEISTSVFDSSDIDDDTTEVHNTYDTVDKTEAVKTDSPKSKTSDILSSIENMINDLDESIDDDVKVEETGLSLDDMIPVKSITFGGLTYKARSTNAIYRWNQIGSIEYMSVAELNEMNNYKRAFLNKPLVILMDERAIKKFRLQKIYENVAQVNNLKSVFERDNKTIENMVDSALKAGMRDILISKVRQMIKNGKLTNVSIIKLLEKKLQYDLMNIVE